MNIKYIKEIVKRLKSHYPGLTAFEILKNMKVVTGFLDTSLNTEIPEGCYFKINGVKFVLIDPNLDDIKKREVYAHELAHAILHPEINTLELENYDPIFVTKLEKKANIFVSEFLLDNNIFNKYYGCSNEYIACIEEVPVKFVEYKYNNLDKSISNNEDLQENLT